MNDYSKFHYSEREFTIVVRVLVLVCSTVFIFTAGAGADMSCESVNITQLIHRAHHE